jgi:hypothetical protein
MILKKGPIKRGAIMPGKKSNRHMGAFVLLCAKYLAYHVITFLL